jgi:hypothetical protein
LDQLRQLKPAPQAGAFVWQIKEAEISRPASGNIGDGMNARQQARGASAQHVV